MASFTDNLVAFNPYVSEVPVDDYVRVGMIKQQQYEQGVQKVQGYIDSIAGIEALKPEQKEYIHQRVSNLQQEIGKVVAGDFSQQQLVNSVGALASKMASDPIVKSTIASTDNYKQQLAAIKEAKEKGKSSISNEWEFSDQFQKWMNDKDVSTQFKGAFTPYTDVTTKIAGIIKGLEPNVHIEDIPFKRGEGGQILLGADGLPEIDWAMKHIESKNLTPERIQQAISANLTQDDLNQLKIDGRYSYRGLDAQGMKTVTDKSYQYRLGQVNDIIEGLIISRQGANNDPAKAAVIDAKIQAYKDKAVQYQNSYRTDIASINTNLEGYKGSLYSTSWLNKFGDSYAYNQESLTYKDNPYFQAAERRRENDIKWQEFLIDQQWKAADLAIKKEQLGISWYNAETARMSAGTKAAKATAKGALEGIGLSEAVFEPIQQATLDEINLDSFLKETQTAAEEIDQQKMALLGNTGLVTVKRDKDGKNPRYEYNVAGKNPQTVILAAEAAVSKLKDAYDKDPNSVDDGTRSYFRTLGNTDQTIQNRRYAIGGVQRDADNEHPLTQVLSKIPPMRIQLPGQETMYLSPKEQLDFNTKLSSVIKSYPSMGTGAPGGTYYDEETANKVFIKPAEKYAYEIVKKYADNKYLNEGEKQIAKRLGDVQMQANLPARGVIAARKTYVNNAVKGIVGVQQPVSFTLEAFEAPDRKRAQAYATRLVNTIVAEDKKSPNPRYDTDRIEEMLGNNAENTTYSLVSKGRGQFSLALGNTKTTMKPVEIDITRAQAEETFGQGKFLDDFYNIRQSLQLTKNTGKWTTDVRNLGKEGAFNLENGQLNRYSVKYHVEEPLKNGGLQVRMYIYDKLGGEIDAQTGVPTGAWLPERTAGFGQLLNEAQVTKFLSVANDQYIKALLEKDKK